MANEPNKGPGTPGFEIPQPDESGGSDNFVAPSAAALGLDQVDAETAAIEAAFGSEILALKAQIEGKLASDAATLTKEGVAVQSFETGNIVGVGLGGLESAIFASEGSAEVTGGIPGEAALVVFTVERDSIEHVVQAIGALAGTRAISTVPMVQVPVGIVDAYSHRFRLRPAPGGISSGHAQLGGSGTLGCTATGLTAPRNSRLLVLSNNHVFARSNNAALGQSIVQPGQGDGGVHPGDQVAILERFVPINFASGAINFVDCATGWAWPDRVRRQLMFLSGGTPSFFGFGTTPVAPAVNMVVGKTGRTTQLRQGRITAVGVSVNVNYNGSVAHFRDQISISGTNGLFSQPGDSGSLIWQWDPQRRAVGLLFAGGGNTTFANRITRVLPALDIRLLT